MNGLRNLLFWIKVVMVCIVLLIGWVGVLATDEWLLYGAAAREKISFLWGLADTLAVNSVIWALTEFFIFAFRMMDENDPDFSYDFDRHQTDEFPSSPVKPR